MNIDRSEMVALTERYLERQGWYQATTSGISAPLELVEVEELSSEQPGLLRLRLDRGTRHLQFFLGLRRSDSVAGALRNQEAALVGATEIDGVPTVLYDALADDECCRQLLGVATDGEEEALRVRHVASLVSHASLVFDERMFMKVYRVLEDGERPEAQVLFGLDDVGFNALIAPVGRWREGSFDLALVREFLPSALEGRLLALTSLRDLLAYVKESEDDRSSGPIDDEAADEIAASAGGDIAGEFVRLGETTARMHLAMAEAFGEGDLGPTDLERIALDLQAAGLDPGAVRDLASSAGGLLGRSVRLHGDYHLRRVMRSDAGWLVTGFGDDPLYARAWRDPSISAERGSPLEDVADLSFALWHVASEAVSLRPVAEQATATPLALAWARRNTAALVRGYRNVEGIERLLPSDALHTRELTDALVAMRVRRYEAMSAL